MKRELKTVAAGQQIGDDQDRWRRGHYDLKAIGGGKLRHTVVRHFDGNEGGAGQRGRVRPSQHAIRSDRDIGGRRRQLEGVDGIGQEIVGGRIGHGERPPDVNRLIGGNGQNRRERRQENQSKVIRDGHRRRIVVRRFDINGFGPGRHGFVGPCLDAIAYAGFCPSQHANAIGVDNRDIG